LQNLKFKMTRNSGSSIFKFAFGNFHFEFALR